ncbi:MAG: hypothetical protein M3N43_14595 [Actinomycetota bacterium]|nr:hypothetical protein [Actinomycetota bacterium]
MKSTRYTIVVKGRMSERFSLAFPGAAIESGAGRTSLFTEPLDQSQLGGFLDRLQAFGLELVSVQERVDSTRREQGDVA